MGTPVPEVDPVIAAIKVEMDAIGTVGTTFERDHNLDDVIEHLRTQQDAGSGLIKVNHIDCESVIPLKGPAAGEAYRQYQIIITRYDLRVGDPDWVKNALADDQLVIDKLTKNDAVFAIAGQRQVRTEDVVGAREQGKTLLSGPIFIVPQTVYRSILTLAVEARDWS